MKQSFEKKSQGWTEAMEAFIIDPAKLIGDIVGRFFNIIVHNNRCVIHYQNTIEWISDRISHYRTLIHANVANI